MSKEKEKIVDARQLSVKTICSFMRMAAGFRSSGYYVGITCDISENKSRHRRDEFGGNDFEYTVIYRCKDFEAAAEVEQQMREAGFDTGDTNTFGNGGTEDSVFVYMFKKPQQ